MLLHNPSVRDGPAARVSGLEEVKSISFLLQGGKCQTLSGFWMKKTRTKVLRRAVSDSVRAFQHETRRCSDTPASVMFSRGVSLWCFIWRKAGDFSKGGRLSVEQNSSYPEALIGNSSFISSNKVLRVWKKKYSRVGKLALISDPYDSVFIC